MTRKNKLAFLIMLFVGLGIFWWEARTEKLSTLIQGFRTLNFWWLLVALLMMAGQLLLEAHVLQVLLRGRVAYFPFRNAARVPMIEQLFNSITPFSSGGQPAQLIAMMQSGIEAGQASSVLLMKFIIYQMMVLINFVLTMLFGFHEVVSRFHGIAWLIVAGFALHLFVIAGLLLVMYQYKFTKKLLQWATVPLGWFLKPEKVTRWKKNLDDKVDTFYAESLHLKREKRKVIKASILTFIQLIIFYAIPYFILLALGQTKADFLNVVAMHVMIVMITSIFPIPGGTGGAEYSFKTLFAIFLTNPSKLLIGMLLWRFVTYYFGMFLGIGALAVPIKAAPPTAAKADQESH
ncbi:lysylphosphatidylglycerol synthase transmembrane domain-containing protein [Agrilactobacillus fermenti]|uniref:lysylphosphatidylglycerol synthase transmembrane domain-containing protein n=1 Tax=Agrilactobacillus fermenti TaxID=2586909 RepID=UPI001E316683|nr:lysylphosphatidylglycerol synthase transmembrane domain-containing protein [Agrilactobacillus fermenti]MCD2257251.1 flippase-like domain-containing protein [Agrilactobacillus fermenti]